MQTEFDKQPNPAEVVQSGYDAVIRLRENITQVSGDTERWVADEYTLTVPWQSTLPQRVNAQFSGWMLRAKATEGPVMQDPTLEERQDQMEAALIELATIVTGGV